MRTRLAQARRWLADPPGPPREPAPPTAAERWTSRWRVAAVAGVVSVTGLAVGLLLAFTD
jgi:hypothetical protein